MRCHRLQNHTQHSSQNSSKRVNHPVRVGQSTEWSPWDGNATIQISNPKWARVLMPRPSSTSSSSARQCGCSWSSKVHSASWGPSVPMAPNGKCWRYPEEKTPRVTRGEVLQGVAPGIHQLFQTHTRRTHQSHIWWSLDHLTHGHRVEWAEDETRMVSPRPSGWYFRKTFRKVWSSQKLLTPQSQRGGGG